MRRDGCFFSACLNSESMDKGRCYRQKREKSQMLVLTLSSPAAAALKPDFLLANQCFSSLANFLKKYFFTCTTRLQHLVESQIKVFLL